MHAPRRWQTPRPVAPLAHTQPPRRGGEGQAAPPCSPVNGLPTTAYRASARIEGAFELTWNGVAASHRHADAPAHTPGAVVQPQQHMTQPNMLHQLPPVMAQPTKKADIAGD